MKVPGGALFMASICNPCTFATIANHPPGKDAKHLLRPVGSRQVQVGVKQEASTTTSTKYVTYRYTICTIKENL